MGSSKSQLLQPPIGYNPCPFFKSTDELKQNADIWDLLLKSTDTDCTIHVYDFGNQDQDIVNMISKLNLNISNPSSDTQSESTSTTSVTSDTNTSISNKPSSFTVLKVHSSVLPIILSRRFKKSSNEAIPIFGFSLNLVKKLFEYQYTNKITVEGNDFLNLILLAQNTGSYLSMELYRKLKSTNSIELSISILKTLHHTGNISKLPYISKCAINFLKSNRIEAVKSDDFHSLPLDLLNLI
ncbi:hypothetical protein DLAC_08083 [Tieghemostelium lacteum]|uniref:Uncharacterized protein n=1 Tax=Tieghemostelium lacteum TaxID=361077 RepID=A0A151ZB42_TIELA|nr:hypothetical protein DLAC_08083 [Tieghemostelium lacteum]|eukprot:KYQ91172.1 hypothetical protein DLAC_08083 [Tieghemostelium lacteum]